MVEPVDPLQGGILDRIEAAPGGSTFNQLGLEEANHGFGDGVVIGVAYAAHDRSMPAVMRRWECQANCVTGKLRWAEFIRSISRNPIFEESRATS